jgi:GNAT superfamily N-acetyltransferase
MATELVPNRTLALRVGYVATDWTKKPDYRAYDDALTEWEVRVMVRDGKAIGAAYTKGEEFHVSVLPEWRGKWATRGILKELIAEPVSVTRVTPGFSHVGGFLKRLGFEDKGDGVFVRTCDHGN